MKTETDFLKDVFQRVAAKLNKPHDLFIQFEQALRRNWYDSPAAIKSIKAEQFEKMGVPLRVSTTLKEVLTELEGQSCSPASEPQKKRPSSPPKLTEQSMLKAVQKVEEDLMKKYPYVGPELLKVLETLQRIIHNIVKDPYEMKFRVLKKSNAKIRELILENEPAVKFLKKIGFEEDEETVCLDKFEVHALFYIEECLDAVVENHRHQNNQQNKSMPQNQPQENLCLPRDIKLPAAEGHSGEQSLQAAFSKEQLDEANYAQVLDQLMLFRNQMMAKPPQNRQLRIYHKRHEVRESNFRAVDFESELQNSDQGVAQYWKGIIAKNKRNSNFQSRRKVEFDYLIKQQVYSETVIKIRMPNEFIIEARFAPLETLEKVFELVAEVVIGDIYLYQSPPVKRMDKHMKQTLQDLDSVPTGSFFLGLNSEWYIKHDYHQLIQK